MITIQISLNGVTTKKEIPTAWEDLTFAQYLGLFDLKSGDAEVLAYFTGVDLNTLLKARIEGLEDILVQLEFLKKPPKWETKPDYFMGVSMPQDITFHSLGPFVYCKNILMGTQDKPIREFVSAYPKYCAIYLQAVGNWEAYDYDKAMDLIPEIENQPAWEVVGLGSFFISKLTPSKKNTQANSPKAVSPRKKNKRVTKS